MIIIYNYNNIQVFNRIREFFYTAINSTKAAVSLHQSHSTVDGAFMHVHCTYIYSMIYYKVIHIYIFLNVGCYYFLKFICSQRVCSDTWHHNKPHKAFKSLIIYSTIEPG